MGLSDFSLLGEEFRTSLIRPSSSPSFYGAHKDAQRGEPARAEICDTLRAASGQRYFYEALVKFSQNTVPVGETYQEWRHMRALEMESGGEIYYLGRN
jgi:hypothetical protein